MAGVELTSPFMTLQRLRLSFEELRGGRPPTRRHERTLLRLAADLGAAAVPLCSRELRASCDARARWAYRLLEHIAGTDAGCRTRVVRALHHLARDAACPDPAKVRALALLTELDAPVPAATELEDLQGVHERSLHQLAACLDDSADVARAADMLCTQLDGDELIEFVDALTELESDRSRRLIDELLLRDDVDGRTRAELRQLRAPLYDRRRGDRARPAAPRRRAPVAVRIGVHASGRLMVVASQRHRGSKPPRWRGFCGLVSAGGLLVDGLYRDDYTARGLDREVVKPLAEQGFCFDEAPVEVARQALLAAARKTRRLGHALPRCYYLGRDLLDIYDQHQLAHRPAELGEDLPSLLARGVELAATGEPRRARPLLERYVASAPDDPEGCAQLGLCLLSLGDAAAARPHLSRAAWLEPDQADHHWNAAAAAHRDGQAGPCYLALVEYLDRAPDDVGEDACDAIIRRHTAEEFVAEYERLSRLEHPDASPLVVARADDLFARARSRLRARNTDGALTALRQAIRLVPSHHRSWRALGVLHSEAGRLDKARRCLEEARELRPADAATQRALAQLSARRAEAENQRRANVKRVRPARGRKAGRGRSSTPRHG